MNTQLKKGNLDAIKAPVRDKIPGIKLGCRCPGPREERKKNWVVTARRCNYSAFNGYKRTPSDYSEIRCTCCGAIWRTKADYVNSLPNVPKGEYIRE